jgi:DNA-binding NarL/FixJ family response regulator
MPYAKLLICDDHPPIRSAVSQIAKQLNQDIVVVEAGTAAEALALLEADPAIELALLDLHMPGTSGLDLLPDLKLRFPSLPVVVLSSDETRATIIDALERGATGYICKSSPTDLLAKFLEHAIGGGIALPTAIVNQPNPRLADAAGPPPATSQGASGIGLSARQADVLACLLRGMSNKQICRDLDLAEGTVKSHVSAIYRALDVSSRAQAVVEASRRGFPVGGRRS